MATSTLHIIHFHGCSTPPPSPHTPHITKTPLQLHLLASVGFRTEKHIQALVSSVTKEVMFTCALPLHWLRYNCTVFLFSLRELVACHMRADPTYSPSATTPTLTKGFLLPLPRLRLHLRHEMIGNSPSKEVNVKQLVQQGEHRTSAASRPDTH